MLVSATYQHLPSVANSFPSIASDDIRNLDILRSCVLELVRDSPWIRAVTVSTHQPCYDYFFPRLRKLNYLHTQPSAVYIELTSNLAQKLSLSDTLDHDQPNSGQLLTQINTKIKRADENTMARLFADCDKLYDK